MVLSCLDLLAVLILHPVLAIYNHVHADWKTEYVTLVVFLHQSINNIHCFFVTRSIC